ncbi:MAG: MBL fold metallo-hydrolase [Planctomycetes bacterium]|nr:MBL fold metallo-hydrolase [Planctomycetota bacterium]
MSLEVLVLGVGDAFSALHYSTCLALRAEGQWLLIDCPHPIRKILRESSQLAGLELDVGDLAGVVVTHLHADHASGLEGLGYFGFFALGRKLPLLIEPVAGERLWEGCLAAGMELLLPAVDQPPDEKELNDYFERRDLDLEASVALGPFQIECRRTIHHIPTTALRITAGGRTLAYSADTAFDPSLIEWLSPGDLVIHETNLGIHTPYERLRELPAELREKMRLIHYPDRFEEEEREIECLREGALLSV